MHGQVTLLSSLSMSVFTSPRGCQVLATTPLPREPLDLADPKHESDHALLIRALPENRVTECGFPRDRVPAVAGAVSGDAEQVMILRPTPLQRLIAADHSLRQVFSEQQDHDHAPRADEVADGHSGTPAAASRRPGLACPRAGTWHPAVGLALAPPL